MTKQNEIHAFLSLLNSVGGVGSLSAWFRRWRGSIKLSCGSKKRRGSKYLREWRRFEVFCSNGIIKNFAKFTGQHLCSSVLLR